MEPAGANDWNLKNMGRTLEAWMNVYKMEESKNKGPYFKLSLSLDDTAQVSQIVQGHWAISFVENEADESTTDTTTTTTLTKSYEKLPFVVDPTMIFGMNTGLYEPSAFFEGEKGAVEIAEGHQVLVFLFVS